MGRLKKVYDSKIAEKVQAMAQYGVPQTDIAAAVDLSYMVLRRLYAKELEKGHAIANAMVGKKLYERCMAGETQALIFWAKCQMRWRETDKNLNVNINDSASKQMVDAIKEAFKSVGK